MKLSFEAALYQQLQDNNIDIIGYIDFTNPDFQRFKLKNKPTKTPSIFIKIHIFDGEPHGASFGDWRNRDSWKTWWYKSNQQASKKERKERKIAQIQIEKEKKNIKEAAIKAAKSIWSDCNVVNSHHEYLIKKKISPYSALQMNTRLVLPVKNINNEIISLQFIFPDGKKQFKKNAPVKQGFVLLGDLPAKKVWLCEGWATGCTIYDLTDLPVICALSAANLMAVAILLRRNFIHTEFMLAADNDEVGLKYAKQIHSLLKFSIFYPSHPGMDFNDLFIAKGEENTLKELLIKKDI